MIRCMNIKKLYTNRFENLLIKQRIWETLVRNFFQKYIDSSDTVIDIGAGNCEFINALSCQKKFALDINPDTKKFATKIITVLNSLSTAIPLGKNSVDKIFVSNLFEHLTRDQIEKTIQELSRILKTKGKVLVLQPNIRLCNKDYWMFFDHITPIDDRALEEIFRLYGFVCEYKIFRFLPYSTKIPILNITLVKLYLMLKPLWYLFGKQSFLIFRKEN